MVAVLNLLDQMTSLLQLELEAEEALARGEEGEESGSAGLHLDRDPLDSLREPLLPCLDLLMSENILSHILATSRMPVSQSEGVLFFFAILVLLECSIWRAD